MKRIFVDTNVVIDFLANRQPFSLAAAELFDMAVKETIKIYISAVSFNNIYYILRQSLTNNATLSALTQLADMIEITDVTHTIIHQSLKTDFKDYEDAIQYYCVLSIPKLDFIVTRNGRDFKKSILPILTSSEALAALKFV